MISCCSLLQLVASMENGSGGFSHGFQLNAQFINMLQCDCQGRDPHTVSICPEAQSLFCISYSDIPGLPSMGSWRRQMTTGHQMMVQVIIIRSSLIICSYILTMKACWEFIGMCYRGILDFESTFESERRELLVLVSLVWPLPPQTPYSVVLFPQILCDR